MEGNHDIAGSIGVKYRCMSLLAFFGYEIKLFMVSSSCSSTLIQKSEVEKTETGGLLSLFLKAATTDRWHGESLE